MLKPVFCRKARAELAIPMPGGGLFSDRGETVDADAPFWRRMIDDGDLVEAVEDDATDAGKHPAKRKG